MRQKTLSQKGVLGTRYQDAISVVQLRTPPSSVNFKSSRVSERPLRISSWQTARGTSRPSDFSKTLPRAYQFVRPSRRVSYQTSPSYPLDLFGQLHHDNSVCQEEADEFPIVELAETAHHGSRAQAIPFQNLLVKHLPESLPCSLRRNTSRSHFDTDIPIES